MSIKKNENKKYFSQGACFAKWLPRFRELFREIWVTLFSIEKSHFKIKW